MLLEVILECKAHSVRQVGAAVADVCHSHDLDQIFAYRLGRSVGPLSQLRRACANLSWKLKRLQPLWFDDVANLINPREKGAEMSRVLRSVKKRSRAERRVQAARDAAFQAQARHRKLRSNRGPWGVSTDSG